MASFRDTRHGALGLAPMTTGSNVPDRRPPERIPAPAVFLRGDDLASWALRPTRPDWAGGLAATWTPGEAGAHVWLDAFADQAMLNYGATRNLPGVEGTSRLSPHLHFGEIGPLQVWRAVTAHARAKTGRSVPEGVETYLSQIDWREYSSHLLLHVPTLPEAPLRPAFADFPWSAHAPGLAAWQRRRTGYPIVDAGSTRCGSSIMRRPGYGRWRHGSGSGTEVASHCDVRERTRDVCVRWPCGSKAAVRSVEWDDAASHPATAGRDEPHARRLSRGCASTDSPSRTPDPPSGYVWSARRAESDMSCVRGGLLCVRSERADTYRRTGRTTCAALVFSVL